MADLLVEIIERCRQGDQLAFREVVKRFQEKALDLARSLIGDQHLAEDALQQGFLIAYCRLDQLRNNAAFPGWFRQIIRTEALRIAQKNKLSSDIYAQSLCSESSPTEYLELQELREMIHQSLSKLSKINQETAKSFYLDEQSCNEIANTLGVPSGTVRRRLHQARNQLRSMLKGYYEESPKKEKKHEQDYGIPL